jgi:hypothetical protein
MMQEPVPPPVRLLGLLLGAAPAILDRFGLLPT